MRLIVVLSCVCAAMAIAGGLAAQTPTRGPRSYDVIVSPGDRGRALLTALKFTAQLDSASTGVFDCALRVALDSAEYVVVAAALRGRLFETKNATCEPQRLLQRDGRVSRIYVEKVAEVRSGNSLPWWDQVWLEIDLQIIHGTTQEWQRIRLRPLGRLDSTPNGSRIADWRVVKFEVLGMLHTEIR